LICEIGLQDLEKVLNLVKTYIKLKSMEIPSSAFFLIQILFFTVDDTFANIFTLCSIYKIFEK